jgi:hypothetical protein
MTEVFSFIKKNKYVLLCIIFVAIVSIKYISPSEEADTHETSSEKKDFISSKTFIGEKKGYVFKTTDNETGYYIDNLYS